MSINPKGPFSSPFHVPAKDTDKQRLLQAVAQFVDAGKAQGWSIDTTAWEASKAIPQFARFMDDNVRAAFTNAASAEDTRDLLMDTPLFEPEQLLGNLITERSLTLIYAQTNVGKTWLALAMANAMSLGTSLMKWEATKQIRVFYMDGEMGLYDLQQRLIKLSNKRKDGGYLRYMNRQKEADQQRLMPELRTAAGQATAEARFRDSQVIVIDNLSSLMGGSGSENGAEDWEPMQQWLLKLRAQGRSVIVLHHAGKRGDARGTSKMKDVMDTVIRMAWPEDYIRARDGIKFIMDFEDKARTLHGEEAEALLVNISPEGQWSWQPHKAPTAAPNLKKSQVIALHKEGRSVRDIERETGVARSTISDWTRSVSD